MGALVFILSIIAAVLLMLVILIQNPKGGGIDSTFGAANQLGSVQKTNDVVEKATWYLAIFIVVLALSSSMMIGNPGTEDINENSRLDPSYRNTMQTTTPIVTPQQKPNQNGGG